LVRPILEGAGVWLRANDMWFVAEPMLKKRHRCVGDFPLACSGRLVARGLLRVRPRGGPQSESPPGIHMSRNRFADLVLKGLGTHRCACTSTVAMPSLPKTSVTRAATRYRPASE